MLMAILGAAKSVCINPLITNVEKSATMTTTTQAITAISAGSYGIAQYHPEHLAHKKDVVHTLASSRDLKPFRGSNLSRGRSSMLLAKTVLLAEPQLLLPLDFDHSKCLITKNTIEIGAMVYDEQRSHRSALFTHIRRAMWTITYWIRYLVCGLLPVTGSLDPNSWK